MTSIPLIVGFGGVNSAGRSSGHHGYRRMIIDSLSQAEAQHTYQNLAALMNMSSEGQALSEAQRQHILDHSLVRRIEDAWYNPDAVMFNKRMPMQVDAATPLTFETKKRNLPDTLPAGWVVTELAGATVKVEIHQATEMLVPDPRATAVSSAGQLPSGFAPGKLYPSRSHPRGLQMTVFGASDALGNLGIDWELVRQHVAADQISVFAGSSMGQSDADGHGGMIGSRFDGKRVTSKNCALGFAEMPADFINAYVIGGAGTTGATLGACASFLYNLRQGVNEIRAGRSRVVIVGGSEAPINPDVVAGYAAMGALATDAELMALDGTDTPDNRRAARPFGHNCGFTIAESAQFVVLFDDALAMELGATVYGAVTDVFINADGYKKSISSPGIGNYLTVAKSMAVAKAILGEQAIQQRSYIHAHGSSTPQNRVTESRILNEVAKKFGISQWPVAAIKAYIGHSLGVSSGDQLINSLGVWDKGIIPGIKTIDAVAEDVHRSNLSISAEHKEVGAEGMDVALLNSKGFGGNNASAPILAPHIARRMLAKKYGDKAYQQYLKSNEAVKAQTAAYDTLATQGAAELIYKFDNNVLGGEDLSLDSHAIGVPGYGRDVDLEIDSPYKDFL
ncbi:beta-ketoacyl synthase [Dasania sp. GY-MA-18]|uniref:Beta-ketoacyl synthase n=1 Tax=Dasania phycosphaerae TaxID=2950436 RepID=A0A9J6RQA6_9GAMM|nr:MULTISPECIES: beta-ketoacyl synthase [Dasania]MCR8924233.1 beta-ketoacyl synthase [Dasania sp. GY-MA-18]MCZ0866886.1 beta-ketoacyl synthase [Dasania phycosphaerae]MCZ0870390.1 beta-ketoacyl synthase [Dasania phycosphaerae]